MATALEQGRNGAICRRLRQLRKAAGYNTATEWADSLGWSVSQLSNYENGSPLSFTAAKQLRAHVPGLTIDWLVYGDEKGLSRVLRLRLREALKTQKKLVRQQVVKKTA